MQSKIRIEFDFETSQPVLRITHAKESDDLRDTMLKAFIEKASFESSTMYVTYPQYSDVPPDNSIVEIRCEIKEVKDMNYVSVLNNSDQFIAFLKASGVEFKPNGHYTDIASTEDIYQLAFDFGKLYQKANPQ